MSHRLRVFALAVCAILLALPRHGSGQVLLYSLFERYIDSLRQQTGIPGMSAAIVKNGRVDWERGFGQQDIERNILAAPDTPYSIGALTQTISAVLLGMCAEQGQLNIDDPISRWVTDFPNPSATVRRVLAHASEAAGSSQYKYDEGRYAALTSVVQACSGKPFRVDVADAVLERLGMAVSVPGQDLANPGNAFREAFDATRLDRYQTVVNRMAVPYRVDRGGRAVRSDYQPRGLTTSDGLVSTVRDLARFDGALDDGVLLEARNLGVAWTPANFDGRPLPTGLGWFVQNYNGERIVWHFSHVPDAYSGLILKMPARNLTLIMLANSDGLTGGANLEQGDVTSSPFVKIFLRLFT
jgi:CubicO group peptidase (beta-lactamase class C family)